MLVNLKHYSWTSIGMLASHPGICTPTTFDIVLLLWYPIASALYHRWPGYPPMQTESSTRSRLRRTLKRGSPTGSTSPGSWAYCGGTCGASTTAATRIAMEPLGELL